MENIQTHLHISHRTLVGAAFAAIVIVMTVLTVSVGQPRVSYQGDIPLPFSDGESDVRGSILYYGKRNNIDVYEIAFNQGERAERMQTDIIYLVHVPTGADVVTTSLDDVISTYNPAGIKNVDYYGYKYSDAVASVERSAIQQPLFRNRFPAKFFASKKARDNDPAHQNALTTFEAQNVVTFLKTDGSAGAVQLEPGSLYAFVVNEANGANIAIRNPICQNGVLESGEMCDDGNANNADCCMNDCTGVLPIPFGTCSSASASSASSVTSSAASSVQLSSASSQASSQAASSQAASSQASSQAASSQAASSQASSQAASSQASSMGPAAFCGNSIKEGSEDCDSGTENGQVCIPPACSGSQTMTGCQYCGTNCQIIVVDRACGNASSTSSAASSQAAVVYALSLAVQVTPATATATAGQTISPLFKFTATAGLQPVLLKGVMLTTQAGTLANATQFELYRTGETTAVATAAPVNGRLTFFRTGGLGTVIPAGTSVDFEVTARAAAAPAADPTLQLALYTLPSNFVIASVGGKPLGDIRTDGTCLFACDINVSTAPATLWTVGTFSPCGSNTPDAGCEGGPSPSQSCTAAYGQTCMYCTSICKAVTVTGPHCGDHVQQRAGADGDLGTADDEECDDGKQCSSNRQIDCTANAALCPSGVNDCVQINNNSCSNACKLVAAPF